MAIGTIQELIDKKLGIEEKRAKIYTVHSDELDMDISYKLATRTEVIQVQKMGAEDVDPYIIFNHVVEPDLSDKELQKAFGMTAVVPYKIVDKIFNRADVVMLSMAIIGEKQPDITGEIKN